MWLLPSLCLGIELYTREINFSSLFVQYTITILSDFQNASITPKIILHLYRCRHTKINILFLFNLVIRRTIYFSWYTQRKYLIESNKLFIWNTFFDVKKCFVLMKQNLFDSNKISLEQINICSNQTNFCLKSNKLYLIPFFTALISLLWRKINLIQTYIYLVQRYFVWIKQILFHLKKSFL